MTSHSVFRGTTLITADGPVRTDASLQDGILNYLPNGASVPADAVVHDWQGRYLLPGLIDCHVHFREPGLTHKATMRSEMSAAVAGGVLTVCEMPNTNPATCTVEALRQKVEIAAALPAQDPRLAAADLRFYFGITAPEHLTELVRLWTATDAETAALRRRCVGLKLFLDHSTGNQKVDGGIIDTIFRTCAELNIPIVAHCEDAEMNQVAAERVRAAGHRSVEWHSVTRPVESEARSITFAIETARKHGTHFHVAHLSTASGLDIVRQAKQHLDHITCEVTPHHLFCSVDDYGRLGTLIKMNPPVRTRMDRDALWLGVLDTTVDCVATDHAPHTLADKQTAEPLQAASGVPGVEVMVPLLLSALTGSWPPSQIPAPAALATPLSIERALQAVHRLCFTRPNAIFRLGKADLHSGSPVQACVLVQPESWTIAASALQSPCGWTPYEGWPVSYRLVTVSGN